MKQDTNFRKYIEPYVTGQKNSCSYCDRIDPLIIYYGEHFYITSAIGSYMPGYIQLCSYKHRTSATGILSTEYDEFEKLNQGIRICFKKVYGTYGICFEHGQAGSCLWTENNINSLCHHMHIHYLPASIDIHPQISHNYSDFYKVNSVADMIKIRKEMLRGGAYLYFSPTINVGYMYDVSNINVPRQFLRRCVAEKLGCTEKADWCSYTGEEYFQSTIDQLKKLFETELKN